MTGIGACRATVINTITLTINRRHPYITSSSCRIVNSFVAFTLQRLGALCVQTNSRLVCSAYQRHDVAHTSGMMCMPAMN